MFSLSDCHKVESIGNGEYGEVFKVEDSHQNIFAAKCFMVRIKDYEKEERKKVLETIANNQLVKNHEAILKCYDFQVNGFGDENLPTLLQEYCPNGFLEDAIPNLTATQKLCNIYGIASAMSMIHSLNILHYNLTPYCILEDENFHPKLKDIGFTKCLRGVSKLTNSHPLNPYIPPESIINGEYTKKSEVYCYGLILYEILTGKKVFPIEGNNYHELMMKIAEFKRPEIPKEINSFFKELIKACWDPDPLNRPTFHEIVKLLEVAVAKK